LTPKSDINLGDWNLKGSESFRVPEGKETNVRSELEELVQLQRDIYDSKSSFNEKLLSLKRKRQGLVIEILQTNRLLIEINKHLGDHDLKATSWLSRCDHVELNAEDVSPNDAVTASPDKNNISAKQDLLYQLIGLETLSMYDDNNLSPLEVDERAERCTILRNERTIKLNNIEGKVKQFEQDISLLRRERSNLLPDVKAKEIRLASLVQEIDILRDLEEKGAQLSSKRDEVNAQQEEVRKVILSIKNNKGVPSDIYHLTFAHNV
jgi:chromosome segregation ATPase